jgi:cell division protein FtsB
MRVFAVILASAVILLQYRVWVSEQGFREVSRLTAAVDAQAGANVQQRARNRQLVAEVNDLKVGLTALEERARSELGMVANSETFYQVVTRETSVPPALSADAVATRSGAPRPGAPQPATPFAITARAR